MAWVMSRLVAAIKRTLTRSSCVPPTRTKVPSSRNRNNLACSGLLMSAISSRKIVPPWASSAQNERPRVGGRPRLNQFPQFAHLRRFPHDLIEADNLAGPQTEGGVL